MIAILIVTVLVMADQLFKSVCATLADYAARQHLCALAGGIPTHLCGESGGRF